MKFKTIAIFFLTIYSISAFSKIGMKPAQPKACEESARTIAYEIGVDEAQGNEPLVSNVKLKGTTASSNNLDKTFVFQIEVENNNEDGEVWIRHIEIQLTKSLFAGACIKNYAKVVKTESVKSSDTN